MKNLNVIADQLFNQIRSRFPSVTIGDAEGNVTNEPNTARFFEFKFESNGKELGQVSISLNEQDGVVVMFSKDFIESEYGSTRDSWYNFLKEMRLFAKKRLLNFEVRDINRSNLTKRDYKFLATNRPGEQTMSESKLYGTNKTSYQKIGNARLTIKHSAPITTESTADRTKNISAIFIESPAGERFRFPFKHLSGARALARHVSEGGTAYDEVGGYITGLSEELSKLRKFKTYMGRSSVMAESLVEYVDVVNERMRSVRKEIQNLQKESFYKEFAENFVATDKVEVPEDIASNWIDQLTIKQFNEELKDVFPYIYNLVSEATKAAELSFDDIVAEAGGAPTTSPRPKARPDNAATQPAETYVVQRGDTLYSIARRFQDANFQGANINDAVQEIMSMNNISDPSQLQVGQTLEMPYFMGTGADGASRGLPPGGFKRYESAIEKDFEKILGQFSEAANDCDETCPKSCPDCGGTGDPAKYQAMKADEGNAYAHAVRQAKMDGKKKGDKVQGPDGEEITLEKEKQIPLGEFILSYFDRETGQFPKGPTAVLTMVEKEYGEQYVRPAAKFIERIDAKVAEVMGYKEAEPEVQETPELERVKALAGLR